MTRQVIDLDERVKASLAKARRLEVAQEAPGDRQAPRPGGTARARVRRPESGGRWETYNAFVDVVSPWLHHTERSVWHYLFRNTRNGTVEAAERTLANDVGIDKKTAGNALRFFADVGILKPVFKSQAKGTASRYALNPRPAECLPAIATARGRNRGNHSPASTGQPGEKTSV